MALIRITGNHPSGLYIKVCALDEAMTFNDYHSTMDIL